MILLVLLPGLVLEWVAERGAERSGLWMLREGLGRGLLNGSAANLGQRHLLHGQRVFLGVRNFGLEGGTSRRGGQRVLGGGLRELLLPLRDFLEARRNLCLVRGSFFSLAGTFCRPQASNAEFRTPNGTLQPPKSSPAGRKKVPAGCF